MNTPRISIPPGAQKGLAWGGGGGMVALIVWALSTFLSESAAMRQSMHEMSKDVRKVSESVQESTTAQKLTADRLKSFVDVANREHDRAEKEREDIDGRLREVERRRGRH